MRWIAGLWIATLLAAGLTVWWTLAGWRAPAARPTPTGQVHPPAAEPVVRESRIADRARPQAEAGGLGPRVIGGAAPATQPGEPVREPATSPAAARPARALPASAVATQPARVIWAADRRAQRLSARLSAARAALRADPYNRRAWQDALEAVREMGDADAWLALLAERARYLHEDAAARRTYGQALLERGRLVEAVSELRAATRLDPDDSGAWFALAEALRAQRRLHEAVRAYRQVLAHEPRRADVLARLGEVLLDLREWDQASRVLSEAIRLDPQPADLRLNHALALWQLGRDDAAIREVEALLEREPENVLALRRLAQWHATLFQTTHEPAYRQQALRYARRALALVPDDPALRQLLDALGPP